MSSAADVAETPPQRALLSEWDDSYLDRIDTEMVDLLGYEFKVLKHERISQKIAANRIYEAAQTRTLPVMLPTGGDFIDVGANIGYYTMLMARLAIGGSIHSFEPNPLPFAILKDNVERNNVTNARINNVALGAKTDTLKIDLGLLLPSDEVAANDYNLGGWSLTRKRAGEHEVQVVTLDDYVEEQKLTNVKFIKIDVEGFERQVLMGAKETLKTMRPNIMIELAAPNQKKRDRALYIMEFLRTRKYNLAKVETQPFPYLRQLRDSDISGETFRFNAFACRMDLGFLGS